jgi:hypothetical protein
MVHLIAASESLSFTLGATGFGHIADLARAGYA